MRSHGRWVKVVTDNTLSLPLKYGAIDFIHKPFKAKGKTLKKSAGT
jgi:FixJ family two-component response regulator